MDISQRKFMQIVAKYIDAVFVVDNLPGSDGLIAMDKVLSQPADGYTSFARMISNVPAVVANEENIDHYLQGFEWIDNIMQDSMMILMRKEENMALDQLISDSREKNGEQIWVGLSTGGIKHIIALKFWDVLGIEAKWVPCECNPEAMKALLAGEGIASVGDPFDGSDRELKPLVIATGGKFPNSRRSIFF